MRRRSFGPEPEALVRGTRVQRVGTGDPVPAEADGLSVVSGLATRRLLCTSRTPERFSIRSSLRRFWRRSPTEPPSVTSPFVTFTSMSLASTSGASVSRSHTSSMIRSSDRRYPRGPRPARLPPVRHSEPKSRMGCCRSFAHLFSASTLLDHSPGRYPYRGCSLQPVDRASYSMRPSSPDQRWPVRGRSARQLRSDGSCVAYSLGEPSSPDAHA